MLFTNGDQARAQPLFEQSLPLYRRAGGGLSAILTATVLGVLGRISALLGQDYPGATGLLEQSPGGAGAGRAPASWPPTSAFSAC